MRFWSKGRSNYYCLRRGETAGREPGLFDQDLVEEFQQIARWAETTADGSREDLSFIPNYQVWEEVCCEADINVPGSSAHTTVAASSIRPDARRRGPISWWSIMPYCCRIWPCASRPIIIRRPRCCHPLNGSSIDEALTTWKMSRPAIFHPR